MKAQMVKNAVIVPVGAKGGFVMKRPPVGGDRDAVAAEVAACYRDFVSALLDLTDNIEGGEVVHPPAVFAYDGDDPYLAVAADKGPAAAGGGGLSTRPGWGGADYARAVIPAGGGVSPRTAKLIPLSAEVRAALGTEAEALRPADLVKAVLRAPVDLLWNGGIGTYRKASTPTPGHGGAKADDAGRIAATQLPARGGGAGG